MYSFFVLGQIPGTSITISFTMWLSLSLLAAGTYLALRLHRRRLITNTALPTISGE
jgi:hypothetical protein